MSWSSIYQPVFFSLKPNYQPNCLTQSDWKRWSTAIAVGVVATVAIAKCSQYASPAGITAISMMTLDSAWICLLIRSQIDDKEQLRKKLTAEKYKEGAALRHKTNAEIAKMQMIQEQMIKDCEAQGIDSKYLMEIH